MTDFQWDVDLDASLFSLEVPSDYTVQQTLQLDLAANPIDYLAETLKLVAEVNDGVFRSELRGDNGLDGIFKRSALALGQKMAEWIAAREGKNSPDVYRKVATELAMKLGGTFGFLAALSAENNDWHYAGKDVSLDAGPADILVQTSQGEQDLSCATTHLSVKEVPAADLRQMPVSETSPKP